MLLKAYNHALINFIPPDANLVLELGCGEGRLGEGYKRRNLSGTYIGIESDPTKSTKATLILDRVITSCDIPLLQKDNVLHNIDCLIIHLDHPLFSGIDPDVAMKQLSPAVSNQCVLLLAYANHRYWSQVMALLRDNFVPGNIALPWIPDQPLFDPEKVKKIINRAGFRITNVYPVRGEGHYYRKIIYSIKMALKMAGGDFRASIREFGQPYFIVQAVKTMPDLRMMIQSLTLEPAAACNDKRIHEPTIFLGTIPGIMTSTTVNKLIINPPTEGYLRVFIWQRPILTKPVGVQTLRKLIKAGYLVIVEFDDDPRRWQKIVDNDYLTFRGVHGVQTSTESLADFLRQFNPNVEIFHNQMMELPVKKSRSDTNIVQIFFGALNRDTDWKPLMPALNRVLKKHNKDVHVNVIHDYAFYEQLQTTQKSFQPTCRYGQYLDILQDCDIALLPLEPTQFNQYKSDLKFIENAACKVISLASPTVYEKSIQDGVTGVLFHSADEFESKLSALITSSEFRSRVIAQAFKWVSKHRMLNRHYRKRYEWYRQMLNRLPELNLALHKRVPELFENMN